MRETDNFVGFVTTFVTCNTVTFVTYNTAHFQIVTFKCSIKLCYGLVLPGNSKCLKWFRWLHRENSRWTWGVTYGDFIISIWKIRVLIALGGRALFAIDKSIFRRFLEILSRRLSHNSIYELAVYNKMQLQSLSFRNLIFKWLKMCWSHKHHENVQFRKIILSVWWLFI